MRHRLVSCPQRPHCRQIALTHRWANHKQLLASIASNVHYRLWLVTTKLHRLKLWVVFDSSFYSFEWKREYICPGCPSSCISHTHAISLNSISVFKRMHIFRMLQGEQQQERDLLCETIVSQRVSAVISSLKPAQHWRLLCVAHFHSLWCGVW